MTDREALIRAVCAKPEDDNPRLIVADHFEENGESERAEFIRVQCGQGVAEDAQMQLWDLLQNSEGWFASFRKPFGIPWDCWGVKSDGSVVFEPKIGPSEFIVSRGFVSAVRTTHAAWIGGPCERCGGTGFPGGEPSHMMDHSPRLCRHCNATGRIPAHGPRIVAEQPVERVEVSDKAPSETPSGWAWWRHAGLDDTDTLPVEVFDCLPDDDASYAAAGERLCWQTRDAAQSALSRALLKWARREAGLTPIIAEAVEHAA